MRRFNFNPRFGDVGPHGTTTPPSHEPSHVAPHHESMRALRYGQLTTQVGVSLTRAGWTEIDLRTPAVVSLVAPMDSTEPSTDAPNYLELYAAPDEVPQENMPALRACGARLWLPTAGKWYLQCLADVVWDVPVVVIDAPNDAWAQAYANRAGESACSARRGFGSDVEVTHAAILWSPHVCPDARHITVRNVGRTNPMRVNIGDTTGDGTRGATIEPDDEKVFEFARFGPASVHAWCDDTTQAQVYVTV